MPSTISSSWTNTAGGLWGTAGNWSGGIPTSSTAATIATTGVYTVSISAGYNAAAYSLLINDTGATVSDLGLLAISSALTVTAGTFTLGSGGDVTGGTITLGSGGKFLNQGGTLSSLSYWGTLDLSEAAAAVTLSGVSFAGSAGGTTTAAISDTGAGAALFESGSGTLNQATLSLGSTASSLTAATLSVLDVGGAGVLTLGNKFTTSITGSGSALISDAGGSGDGIVNNGTITVAGVKATAVTISGNSFTNSAGASMTVSGGTVHLTDENFTNAGTLVIGGTGSGRTAVTGTLSIGGTGTSQTTTATVGAGTFAANSGLITVSGGFGEIDSTNFSNTGSINITSGKLELGGNVNSQTTIQTNAWSSTGAITQSGGTLLLNGSFTTASLNDITHTGGTLEILGTDNNVGQTINVGTGSLLGTLTAGNYLVTYGGPTGTTEYFSTYGYIVGGTIHDAGGGFVANYATLDDVTFQGTLNVNGKGTDLSVNDGITLQNLAGNGPGALVIGGTAHDAYVALYGSTDLNNATVTMGSNSTTSTSHGTTTVSPFFAALYTSDLISGTGSNATIVAATLTLGSGLIINESTTAHEVDIFAADDNAADAIVNQGVINATSATGDLSFTGNTATNSGIMALSGGGTLEIDSYNQFINSGTITNSYSTLFINSNATGPDGAVDSSGDTIIAQNSFTNLGTIISTGGTIALAGTLTSGWQGHISATGGQTYIQEYGYAQDAGTTLTVGTGAAGAANLLVIGGTIIGGTIDAVGTSAIDAAGGTLDGVTWAGSFDPLEHAASVTTTTVTGTGSSATTLVTPNYPGLNEHYVDLYGNVTFTGANGSGAGSITLTNGVSLFGIDSIELNNVGISIGAAAGATVALGEDSHYHGTFTLGYGATVTEVGASATLQSGTGSTDLFYNQGVIDTAAGGTITLTGNAFTNAGTVGIAGEVLDTATIFTNSGDVFLSGGTLDSNDFTNAAGGVIVGTGLVETATAGAGLINNGVIWALGGTLTVAPTLTGNGTLAIGAGSTLVLDNPGSQDQNVIAAASGVLDLVGDAGASAAIAGGALVVSLAGGGTESFTLTNGGVGETVATSSDGAGGTDIEFYNLAQASLSTAPITLGNAHVGASDTVTLSLSNIAAAGAYTEALDAILSAASGAVSGSGSITGLAGGATDSSDLVLTLSTSAAGLQSGSILVSLYSDGTGIDGNGPTLIGTDTISATGAVYAYAAPTLGATTIDLGSVRVGGTLGGSFTLADGTVASAYQESLDYVLSGAGSGSGSLASGSSATLGLSLGTASSGTISATGSLGLVSDGSGTSGLGTTALGSEGVTVTGTVYQTAAADFSALSISIGNVHVGDSASGSISLENGATGALVDELLAHIHENGAGFATSTSTLTLASLASGLVGVTLNTAAAGSFSGSLSVLLKSYDSALGSLFLGTQAIALSGAVYAYAAPSLSTTTIDLGATRVGGTLESSFTLSNGTVATAYQENLDYFLSGAGTASGSLIAGGSTGLFVSLNTSISGDISSTGSLGLISDGTGTSGLGDTALGAQDVTVTGTVYQTAAADFSALTISLGNVHVGDTDTGAITLANGASGALVDELLAGLTASGAGFSLSSAGSLTLDAADGASISVGLDTSAAGGFAGDLAVALNSYDSALGSLFLGTQHIDLTGAVYAYAAPSLSTTTIDLGAVRAGGALSGSFTLADGATASAYQEGLLYTVSGAGSASGSLASGDSTSVAVGLDTSDSGTISGTATLGLASDGDGTSGLGTTALGGQDVTVTGTVYQTASAGISTTDLSLGIVHVGDTDTGTVTLTNIAQGALVDQLIADLAVTGAFSGSTGSLVLSALESGAITVSLDTNSAGVFDGTLTLDLASYDSALGSLGLGDIDVTLSGTVDKYAALGVSATGAGTFTGGSAATLSFGNTYFGTNSEAFSISNAATGQADLLSGSIALVGSADGFVNTGLGSFTGLTAGEAFSGLGVSFDGTLSGTYSETLTLTGTGYNGSGYSGSVGSETIVITDTVIGVYVLGTHSTTITAGSGTDFFYAGAADLVAGDNISGGAGTNTLVLTGSGAFDLATPKSLTDITTVQATELAAGEQTVTLSSTLVTTVDVTSVAGGSISIIGSTAADKIYLGNGTDTITVGAKETIYGGSGTDIYNLTAATEAAKITAGSGISDLDFTGGGTVKLGANLTGSFTSVSLAGGNYTFTADTQAGLAITAVGGTDKVTVGAASQSVTGTGGAAVTVDASTANAGVALSGVGTLTISGAGMATLNAGDTALTVNLSAKHETLHIGTLGFITAIAETTNDTLTAGGANQILESEAGKSVLTGYTGFGDTFEGTLAGLKGDSIYNFGGSDVIDITNLGSVTKDSIHITAGKATIDLTGSSGSTTLSLFGSYTASDFAISSAHGATTIWFV